MARLREQGEAVHLVSKTHCSATEPGPGGADGRPLGAQVRARGQRAKAGGGGDHAAGHGALGGPERRREVPAAGRLPAVAGRAGLLGRLGALPLLGPGRQPRAAPRVGHREPGHTRPFLERLP